MEKIKLFKSFSAILIPIIIMCLLFTSCEEYPNAYKSTDGIPEVFYVRYTSLDEAERYLDGAFMGEVVCIVGNNLRSVHEVYFNDQKAVLNTSFITDNTLIVGVPGNIPVNVTNKIYLITYNGQKVDFNFKTKVPPPIVAAISCEYAPEGSEAVLYGDFLIDDPNVPLKITFAGNIPVTEIIEVEKTKIRFVVPAGVQKGYITVETIYGTGRSKFQYKDDRGMILDWDNLNADGGWRPGRISAVDGISGKYVIFSGNLSDGDWNEDNFSFNLWGTANGRPEGDFFDARNLDNLLFKFEINVLEDWSANAMQIIFTPWNLSGDNNYIAENGNFKDGYARALWIPWATTGKYKTDGWITVTIPMKDFVFSPTGKKYEKPNPAGNYGGLTMYVWNGGIEGTPCTTEMWLDNMRVVEVE